MSAANREQPLWTGRTTFRMDEHGRAVLELRHEDDGTDIRHLDAYLDDAGSRVTPSWARKGTSEVPFRAQPPEA